MCELVEFLVAIDCAIRLANRAGRGRGPGRARARRRALVSMHALGNRDRQSRRRRHCWAPLLNNFLFYSFDCLPRPARAHQLTHTADGPLPSHPRPPTPPTKPAPMPQRDVLHGQRTPLSEFVQFPYWMTAWAGVRSSKLHNSEPGAWHAASLPLHSRRAAALNPMDAAESSRVKPSSA